MAFSVHWGASIMLWQNTVPTEGSLVPWRAAYRVWNSVAKCFPGQSLDRSFWEAFYTMPRALCSRATAAHSGDQVNKVIPFNSNFFLSFFFGGGWGRGHACSTQKFQGQAPNPHWSSNPSCSIKNTRALTCSATKEFLLFFLILPLLFLLCTISSQINYFPRGLYLGIHWQGKCRPWHHFFIPRF